MYKKMTYKITEINNIRMIDMNDLSIKQMKSFLKIPEGHSIFTIDGCFRKTSCLNPENPPRASYLMIHADDYKKYKKI
jgi:hypothetical protein